MKKLNVKPAYFKSALMLLIFAFWYGCASNINYDSHANPEVLRQLKGKKVLLLQFTYKDDVLVGVSPLEGETAKQVAKFHKAKFISEFRLLFTLKDISASAASTYGAALDPEATAFVRNALRAQGADAGFIVTNSYGYKMAGGSIYDRLIASILELVLPKKWVGVLTGPSQIEAYDFASNTVLFNREGRVIWSFYGKASAMPKLSEMIRPKDFGRSLVGLDPPAQSLAAAISHISYKYTDFIYWIMQQDIEGDNRKNYFIDYPSGQRDGYISIFPADDKTHVPYVREYNFW